MLKIKLARIGKIKQPTFRITISEHTKDTFGPCLENLGNYNPRTKALVVDSERVKYWISKGAQPTYALHNLFIEKGIISGKKLNITSLTKKRRGKLEKAKAALAAKAAEVAKSAEAAEVAPKLEA